MERTAWTDQRLDDLAQRIDAGFARVDGDIRELRGEMRAMRGELGADMRDMRGEIRGEIDALRLAILRVGGGMMIGLAGVIAAVLARGV